MEENNEIKQPTYKAYSSNEKTKSGFFKKSWVITSYPDFSKVVEIDFAAWLWPSPVEVVSIKIFFIYNTHFSK